MIDKNCLSARRVTPHQDQDRNPFLRDKARILHSAFFRRLQSKKQVLDHYVNDFIRTRLTHTLEVAQISVGICDILKKNNHDKVDYLPSIFCIEAIALAHDLGHPPNGHGGENALNYLMRNDGGFEGNAHTFRIASKLGEGEIDEEEEDKFGLNLTRATMLGILKYPIVYSSFPKTQDLIKNKNFPKFSQFKPPKCIFDEEKNNLDWVLEPFNQADTQKILHQNPKNQKFLMNFFASIMTLADDIAYGVHDLEDGLALNLVSVVDLKNTMEEFGQGLKPESKKTFQKEFESIINNLDCPSKKQRKIIISKIVHFFICHCQMQKKNFFDDPILDYDVCLAKPWGELLQKFKELVDNKIIKSRGNCISEFKLQNIIVKVFECLQNNSNLLPIKYQEKIKKDQKQANRILCDYIAGMTDKHLTRVYKALFFPEVHSIFDKL